MRSYVLLSFVTGCSFTPPLPGDNPRDGSTGDGDNPFDSAPGIDGTPDMPCFGPAGWEVCLPEVPTNTETISGTFDTTNDSQCADPLPTSWMMAGQPDACIVIGQRIDVTGAEVVVRGSRPLVLVASDTIDIEGILDIGSHRSPANVGPGAPSVNCTTGNEPETEGVGGGGGAGGAFVGEAGRGGRGDQGDDDADGGDPGAVVAMPDKLRAGCAGQIGAGNGGAAGQGGGGAYLVAGVAIMGGRIDASGAGAREAAPNIVRAGGSGGGSGGMVVLYAPEISLESINANGGGGASGTSSQNSGDDGDDADVAQPGNSAKGGTGVGGRGGDGSVGATKGEDGGQGGQNIGGGGGGGGAGSIRANVKPSDSLSPPYSGV